MKEARNIDLNGPRRLDTASTFTPREIVSELDRFIIGQARAKRMVGIALRNRWRRQQVPPELRDEIAPKNIIMIGPTGVGKTEIARRLAKLAQAPFIKIEASKFTEVGYVGRDVDSMIRDLTELAVTMVREEEKKTVRIKAEEAAEERLLDLLLPRSRMAPADPAGFAATDEAVGQAAASAGPALPEGAQQEEATRQKLRRMLREGRLDDRFVELEVSDRANPVVEIISSQGVEEMDINVRDFLGNMMPRRTRRRKMRVSEARDHLAQEEAQKLVDMEKVVRTAIRRVEQSGIVFLDELDKIAGRQGPGSPDVSREGVQRDLLPIIEGSVVHTKYGMINTDHILFIAAGAFHVAKPSDLIPELQGRFPIRVELDSLGEPEFVRILTEPRNALLRQYIELMKTEGVQLEFKEDAVAEIAHLACLVNERTENIGARRLHTVVERLLEDISFDAPDTRERQVVIDAATVREKLVDIIQNEDLSRYIL